MFVGLTISNMEPENLANVLRRPLLSDHVQEVSQYFPLRLCSKTSSSASYTFSQASERETSGGFLWPPQARV